MTRLHRTLAHHLRTLADRLDPSPHTVSVRLTADTTAFREAMADAHRQWRATLDRTKGAQP